MAQANLSSVTDSSSATADPTSAARPEDAGLWALAGVALYFDVEIDLIPAAHELALTGRKATTNDLVRLAAGAGLKAQSLQQQRTAGLATVPRPAILRMGDGQYSILGERALSDNDVLYCGAKYPVRRSNEQLDTEWSGELIVVTRLGSTSSASAEPAEFGIHWFMPSILRYRRTFLHVLLASVFLQLCGLISPLFFQLIIDKVLVHFSIATLTVACAGMLLSATFEATLQYLRAYALMYTGSRLDVELGGRLFSHLLKLPLAYFESTATGQIVARMREVETVRRFLTGQTLTSVIDIVFSFVFIAVMFSYSGQLTLIVVATLAVYVLIATLVRPALRERSKEAFKKNAETQQFVVESISGMGTLKAAAVEGLLKSQWLEKLRAYVQLALSNSVLGALTQSVIQYTSKISTIVLLFFGSRLVMNGELTIGQLIAFNMLAGLISAPILRLSSLWQDFQGIQVSVERLGDIMKTPAEIVPTAVTSLPPIRGAICLRDITFRYAADGPDVLRGVSLDIPQGQVLGVVGPSGSGKSTLTKLIQRLYSPQRGQITVDGIDIARVHPTWLRQQIGVVLQENLLFTRTVHDNIALAAPYLTREQVIGIAQQAGAHEFISQLPRGYDTRIEERGANLSGGQRQRIAIARALARNPRVLILDEATSAIDYESERIVQSKLREFVRGRTVIIIAHRLAAVRYCDRIVAVVDGRIVEDGTHDELIRKEGGTYRHLWKLQISTE